jgi:hypothetical protein
VSKLPTDREVLKRIYDMYEPSYPGARPGENDPYVAVDLAAVAARLRCKPELLFGRLYYHPQVCSYLECLGLPTLLTSPRWRTAQPRFCQFCRVRTCPSRSSASTARAPVQEFERSAEVSGPRGSPTRSP